MLSKADNELLTRVGPGTIMGEMLRQYWHPFLLSSELPERDGAPIRCRILGEDLIAFRTTSGKVGVLGNHCPHRGASLFFGRNEEEGLRCVYHGWKFDVEGNCVDMPNEPPESNFKHKIHHTSYKLAERNGLIWIYMGAAEQAPTLPDLEWNLVPENQAYVSKRVQICNWAQALEGGIDNAHASFLHARLRLDQSMNWGGRGGGRELEEDEMLARKSMFEHRNPRFETVDMPYGVAISAGRPAGEGKRYYRITQFLMPYYSMIASNSPKVPIGGHAWVPIDDENCMTWSVEWHPSRPLDEEEIKNLVDGFGIHSGPAQLQPATSRPNGAWYPIPNVSNDWWQDREAMKTARFAGVPYTWLQDQAVQESMKPIYDRTKEHLGSSDAGIIRVRRLWISSAKALQEHGSTPPGVANPESYKVRSVGIVLPENTPWVEGAKERMVARPGVA